MNYQINNNLFIFSFLHGAFFVNFKTNLVFGIIKNFMSYNMSHLNHFGLSSISESESLTF